jgi:hypothetical protein
VHRGLQKGVTTPRGGGKFCVDSAANTNSGKCSQGQPCRSPIPTSLDELREARISENVAMTRDCIQTLSALVAY